MNVTIIIQIITAEAEGSEEIKLIIISQMIEDIQIKILEITYPKKHSLQWLTKAKPDKQNRIKIEWILHERKNYQIIIKKIWKKETKIL